MTPEQFRRALSCNRPGDHRRRTRRDYAGARARPHAAQGDAVRKRRHGFRLPKRRRSMPERIGAFRTCRSMPHACAIWEADPTIGAAGADRSIQSISSSALGAHSGWPFGIKELRPYFKRAQALVEAGPWSYDARTNRCRRSRRCSRWATAAFTQAGFSSARPEQCPADAFR